MHPWAPVCAGVCLYRSVCATDVTDMTSLKEEDDTRGAVVFLACIATAELKVQIVFFKSKVQTEEGTSLFAVCADCTCSTATPQPATFMVMNSTYTQGFKEYCAKYSHLLTSVSLSLTHLWHDKEMHRRKCIAAKDTDVCACVNKWAAAVNA